MMKRPATTATDMDNIPPSTKRTRFVTPDSSLDLSRVGAEGGVAMPVTTTTTEPSSHRDAQPVPNQSAAPETLPLVPETKTSQSSPSSSSSQSGGLLASLVSVARRAGDDAPEVAPTPPKTGRWTKREDHLLRQTVGRFEGATKDWKQIARTAFNGGRSDSQCLERWEKVLKLGLVKGPWTPEEDDIVRQAVESSNHDLVNWAEVAKLLPGRLTKQVRERWQNHLNPELVKSPWTEEEDYLLVSLQAVLGNRWNEIARAFQGRSENAIKNRWNSKQRRTLLDAHNKPADTKPSILPTNVCRNVNFHKALVKASGNDPEINEAASILVNKVSRSVAVQ